MSRSLLRFVTRQDCGLCEEAASRVQRAACRLGVEVVEIDVDADEHLRAAFGARVPVLLNARDKVLAEGSIGLRAAWLAAARVRLGAFQALRSTPG